jgi:hypothetical protein
MLTIGLMSAGTSLALVDTRPVSVKAHEWALENAASLPDTLEELLPYPVPYRLAAFQRLPPTSRSGIVQAHLAAFAHTEALTSEQKGLISEMAQLLDPQAYTESGRRTAQEKVAPICRQIANLFSPAQRAKLGTLGPSGQAENSMTQFLRLTKNFVGSYLVYADVSNRSLEHCSCAIETSCPGCTWTYAYCGYEDGCTEVGFGCGCGFIWTCDGECVPWPIKP